MFHQRQKGSYCRCHAINNLIGRELITLGEFDKYCNEFDKLNGFVLGSSKKGHLFYNNGGTNNIFGYILEKKGIKIKMDHYDFYRNKKIKNCEKSTIGYIIYNRGHTYCVRINGREKWLIDSMKQRPFKLDTLTSLERKGIGVICVTLEGGEFVG
jgi:hypothetical protein